ncbi:MAG: tetratricopeptide repeat protein [Candidatus Korarchaeota archaeon]
MLDKIISALELKDQAMLRDATKNLPPGIKDIIVDYMEKRRSIKDISSNDANSLEMLAEVAAINGNLPESIRLFKKSTSIDPSVTRKAKFVLFLERLGEYNKAREILRKLLKEYPDSPELLATHAVLLLDAGHVEKSYQIVKQLHSDDIFVKFLKATILRRSGLLKDALKLYDEILACEPEHHKALIGRAQTRWALNDQSGAMEDINTAIKIAPTKEAIIVKYSFCLMAGLPCPDVDERLKKLDKDDLFLTQFKAMQKIANGQLSIKDLTNVIREHLFEFHRPQNDHSLENKRVNTHE